MIMTNDEFIYRYAVEYYSRSMDDGFTAHGLLEELLEESSDEFKGKFYIKTMEEDRMSVDKATRFANSLMFTNFGRDTRLAFVDPEIRAVCASHYITYVGLGDYTEGELYRALNVLAESKVPFYSGNVEGTLEDMRAMSTESLSIA